MQQRKDPIERHGRPPHCSEAASGVPRPAAPQLMAEGLLPLLMATRSSVSHVSRTVPAAGESSFQTAHRFFPKHHKHPHAKDWLGTTMVLRHVSGHFGRPNHAATELRLATPTRPSNLGPPFIRNPSPILWIIERQLNPERVRHQSAGCCL